LYRLEAFTFLLQTELHTDPIVDLMNLMNAVFTVFEFLMMGGESA
jgi:hypothetical protein